MRETSGNQKLLTTAELADALAVSTKTVRRLTVRGRLRPYRLSAVAVRYDLSEVLADLREPRDAQQTGQGR